MKRVVFLVDKEQKGKAEKLLLENGIGFSWDDRLHFDFRTAIIVFPIAVVLTLLAVYVF